MGIYYFSAVAFLASTAGFVGLGIAVYRRAQRSAEVNVLLLMLLYFSLQSFLLSLDALFFGILSIVSGQAHELLSAAASSLQLLSLAAVLHFVFLTFSRALDESGLLADPFSRLRDYKVQYWFWVCVIYSMPVAGIVGYAGQAFRAWQAHPSGELKLPPMPSLESSGGTLLLWWFFSRSGSSPFWSRGEPHHTNLTSSNGSWGRFEYIRSTIVSFASAIISTPDTTRRRQLLSAKMNG